MDGDARLGPVCETIVNGRYFWLPFSAIAEIRFQAPASVTDLVWRHALVRLTDGTEQVCQIPARYPFAADASDAVKLGAPPTGTRSILTARFMKAGPEGLAERAKRKPAAVLKPRDVCDGWSR
jgi:hypothetical protein